MKHLTMNRAAITMALGKISNCKVHARQLVERP